MSSIEKESEVELDLECSLCKDTFREPKTLSCLHSFCLECLEIYVERNHSNLELRCPICRTSLKPKSKEHLSNLPTDSFLLNALNVHSSLENASSQPQKKKQKLICLDGENEATSYCLDCEDYFCEMCAKAHQKTKATINHQLIPVKEMKNSSQNNSITTSSSQIYCQIHQQKEIDLFCNDCQLPICSLCVSQHRSHKILSLPDIIENEKQSLLDLINQVKPKEKKLQEGINNCEEVINQLEINSTTTQTQINQLFKEIRTKLDEKEQELLDKLNEIEKQKKKELELQKEELKFGIESIIGSCQMIENSLSLSNNPKNNVKLLSMKKLYQSRLDYLLNNRWKVKPYFHSIEFFSLEEESIYSSISNIGIIESNDILKVKHLESDQETEFEAVVRRRRPEMAPRKSYTKVPLLAKRKSYTKLTRIPKQSSPISSDFIISSPSDSSSPSDEENEKEKNPSLVASNSRIDRNLRKLKSLQKFL